MNQFRVVITDHGFPNLKQEEAVFAQAGLNLTVAQCKTAEQVIVAAQGADALLVQWAPVTSAVIAGLDRCRVIVRYGIGVDNVDLAAARAKGIAVCNVPDYGVHEVAEHAVALAAALQAGAMAGAGLDVYEVEPLPADHPIRTAPRALLTSHVAWYSESSIPRLQQLAAEEVVRCWRGEALKNCVN